MENLGLGYLAHFQLGLRAEMKEMGRMAPSLSSGGGKLAAASQLPVLPFPWHFNERKKGEGWNLASYIDSWGRTKHSDDISCLPCTWSVQDRKKDIYIWVLPSFWNISFHSRLQQRLSIWKNFFFFLKKELFCHNMFMLVFVQGQCGDIECFVSHVKPYIFMSVHAHDMPVSCNMYACK